jgi:cytochrome P450
MDRIADYALPLAVTVITEMLGVPATNREQLREWSNALAAAIDIRQSLEVTA